MNKKHYLLLALTVLISLSAVARDRLYIENFQIQPGSTYRMPLILENDTIYSTFQTDLYLPEGLEVALDEGEYIVDLTERVTNNHVVSTYRQPDGAIRIYVTSQSVKPFSGHSGAIAIVEINALPSFSGEQEVSLRGTVFVEENGQRHDLDDYTAIVSDGSSAGVIGDVNCDGHVTTADITALYNYILEGDTTYIATSDVNGDGSINTSDITVVYNILLGV